MDSAESIGLYLQQNISKWYAQDSIDPVLNLSNVEDPATPTDRSTNMGEWQSWYTAKAHRGK